MATSFDQLKAEKELLGVYVIGHPLDAFQGVMTKEIVPSY